VRNIIDAGFNTTLKRIEGDWVKGKKRCVKHKNYKEIPSKQDFAKVMMDLASKGKI